MIFGWGVPWALPKVTVCMVVGHIVGGGAPDPGLPENGDSGLNRKQTHGTNQTHAATALWSDGVRG